ncbi:MAG: hypothetical protein PHW43_09965 [Syntrophales bacterium]|nr:hypothetical protein [Syntrophales bacterium]
MPEGKFCRVDKFLRIAVGVEVPNKSITRLDRVVTIPKAPGVVEVWPYPKRDSTKAYLKLDHGNVDAGYPEKIQAEIPEVLDKAPWGEILFNNNETGAQVLFGREGEEKPFGPERGKYVVLRLYRETEHPFKSIFARVDKGDETYFFALKARWEGETITIEIERNPSHIPQFLN